MSLGALNKMLKKTPSQDSNFEKIWWEMEEIEPLTPMVLNKEKRSCQCGRKSRV